MFPLPGQRHLLVSALIGALAAPIARAGIDDASRYSGTNAPSGWISGGHRGDIDFGLWEFEATANGGSAGRFLGDSSLVGASVNTGGQAFGLFAHPPQATAPVAAAIRKFAKPALTTGDTLSFQLAVNYRNGTKGFTLRNAAGTSQWNFSVGRVDGSNDGYYIRNGVSGSAFDNGQRFGGYSANTVFTFTFTQRERQLQWTAVRSGGISATVSGALTIDSGTIADLRFFITGTEASGTEPRNNLYFNNLNLVTESRGDGPLTIGERRTPGVVPSYLLRFTDPNATSVTMRHGGDNFANSYSLSKGGDGVWSIDIRNVLTTPGGQPLQPGWHEFKFRLNSVFESGDNRMLFIDQRGRVATPPAVYLTWQRDPTTTMTVHWHNYSAGQNGLRYRANGAVSWTTATATTQQYPHSERLIHTAEVTGLNQGADYEFQVDGYTETYKFRTMPATLTQPLKFGVGGDVDIGSTAETMTAAIASKDPAFLVVGGDHAYENARAENFWMWYRYLEAFHRLARAPDGRLIPLVVGIGNHEVHNGWAEFHPDFENTAEWRDRYAMFYYRCFAFPGAAQPYGVLDFGSYLSLIITDTEHSSPRIGATDPQTQWLSATLNARRHVSHLVPIHHVPAYTSYRSFADPISQRMRQHWVPLYESTGVKLVFEHHDHTFKRSKALLGGAENAHGIRFLGDGLWGIASRTPDTSRSYLDTASDKHHVHLVTITPTNRTVEAVDLQGDFFGGALNQPIDGIPSVPITPTLVGLATNSASFTWVPVGNATNYAVLRNGLQIGTTTSTNFTDNEWSPSSNATYQVVVNNRSGSATNVAPGPSARNVWNVTNNLPWDGSGIAASTADPDADGMVNLAEYFHGLNPRAAEPSSAAAVNSADSSAVSVRYRVNPAAVGVQSRIEQTSDLRSGVWTTNGLTHTTLSGEWAGWRSVSMPVSDTNNAGFLRLIISD